jgi:two-component system, NarL family, nitrate/nitrite response regulator NarL
VTLLDLRAPPSPLGEDAMTDVTVVLIDRDLLFSRGLELLLERVSGGAVRVVGHATDGCAAAEVVRRQRPDVAIVGLSLPAPGALPVIRELKRLYPWVRVIAMGGPGEGVGGGDCDTDGAVAALRAGADGLIDTTAPPETLLAPLRATAAGMAVVPPAVMAALVDAPARHDRERVGRLGADDVKLWRLVADGLDTTDISRALMVSERTAKRRVSVLLTKLRVGSRLQAAALAGRCGLLDTE